MNRSSSTLLSTLVFLVFAAGPVSADCDALVVRDTTLDRDEYGTRIVGEALHYTKEPLENLTLSFALYKRGQGVGGASADRERLEPGDTWNFVARTSTDDFDGYRLAAKFCDIATENEGTVSWIAPPRDLTPGPWRFRSGAGFLGPPDRNPSTSGARLLLAITGRFVLLP